MIHTLNGYERQLLEGWEEVYKRGQLTLWIMLALQDSPKHMSSIKEYVEANTGNAVSADDQSMYRALRRYTETELVTYRSEPTERGPDRKIYQLTDTGSHVLEQFITRNISSLVNQPIIKRLTKEK